MLIALQEIHDINAEIIGLLKAHSAAQTSADINQQTLSLQGPGASRPGLSSWGDQIMLFNRPVTDSDNLEQLKSHISARGTQVTYVVLSLVLLAISLGAAIVFLVVNRTINSVHVLKEAMINVGQGDMRQRVDLRVRDEVGALAENFNSMVARLAQVSKDVRVNERYLSAIMDNVPDAIVTTDEHGIIQSWNYAAEGIFGIGSDEIIGKNVRAIMPAHVSKEHDAYIERYVSGGDPHIIQQGPREVVGRRADGSELPLDIAISEMVVDGQRRFIGILRDISERKEHEKNLMFLSRYDSLTKLPNRALLRERLQAAMKEAECSERLVAVLVMDLDEFKTINESLGHEIGDQLLMSVTDRLLECTRSQDTVARLDGDEFCIVLSDIPNVHDSVIAAQKVLDALAHHFTVKGYDLYLSVSIGITVYPFDDDDVDTLIRSAETAMHRVKEAGGGAYQFFSDAMHSRSMERLKLSSGLREALQREEFELYYQPQVDIGRGEIVGVEALIRWNHPEFGIVSPAKFIPLLEETGLIVEVGEWAMRTACRQTKRWHQNGFAHLRVGVNLSARQFRDQGLVDTISQILSDADLDPHYVSAQVAGSQSRVRCLELELTEGLLMDNVDASCAALDKLKDMGIKISIDDFGTGYSSLSYLKRFPIDTLKIDRSFVREIGTVDESEDTIAIITAIIDLAHNLDLRVIAEGVETTSQLRFLKVHECDEIQGYLVSRPLPASEFERWLYAWGPDQVCADWLVDTVVELE